MDSSIYLLRYLLDWGLRAIYIAMKKNRWFYVIVIGVLVLDIGMTVAQLILWQMEVDGKIGPPGWTMTVFKPIRDSIESSITTFLILWYFTLIAQGEKP